MTEQPPESVRERLIENVPILVGRTDANGAILEIEGSLPHVAALPGFDPGHATLSEIFPDVAPQIRAALDGGESRIETTVENGDESAYFELRLISDRRRGAGVYFLIHDVTDTRLLQLALLDCSDREQMRVGQDIHDTLGQELTGISYQLHALRKRLPPDLTDSITKLQARISGCLRQSRDIAFKLSPQIAGEDICNAFERLCKHLHESFGVECTFEHRLSNPITDAALAFHLFRIAQEASTNAMRHAEPRCIDIRLSTGESGNTLEISDNGQGIAPSIGTGCPGMGIPMMKFRTRAIGGSLQLLPRFPSGTLVRCRFDNTRAPLHEVPVAVRTCPTCL
jgi:signal transduction histidine kinase